MSRAPIRIAINGFGRIGRTLLRILLSEPGPFEIVLINDVEPLETCAYLFEYDSVFGPWGGEVSVADGALIVDAAHIPFRAHADLSAADLSRVDVVLECTGLAGARAVAQRGLAAGARAVLVSGPSSEADTTIVMGANETTLGDEAIVSNASCTTNALAPLLKVLDTAFGITGGHMTTIHCYTGSQPTVDKPRGDPARSRAAALSMVPTTTSAGALVGQVLPGLAGLIEMRAVRVPTASVSAIDLVVGTRREVTADTARAVLLEAAAAGQMLGWTDKPLVSSDLRKRPESLVICGPELSVSASGLLRVFGWYDNEWGFARRMLDVAQIMAQRNRDN